jgi:hypothetical protein
MKKILTFYLLLLISSAGAQEMKDLYSEEESSSDFPIVDDKPFEPGEEIEYKIYFGFFTIGKGRFKVQSQTYKINGRRSYKVDVQAKTTGMIDWIAKVDDHWGGYIDSTSLNPHKAYRIIKEGKYRKNEVVNYDHTSQMLEVKSMGRSDKDFTDPMYYQFPQQVKDLISGFAYLRAMNFDTLNIRDTVSIPAFFEDTFYDMKIVYLGIETLETEIGKFRAHKLTPIMPENKIFDGQDAISAWFSADKNKVPLKISAQLFIGSGGLEITSFRKVKYPLNFVMQDD